MTNIVMHAWYYKKLERPISGADGMVINDENGRAMLPEFGIEFNGSLPR
jgi:hypothetical protein